MNDEHDTALPMQGSKSRGSDPVVEVDEVLPNRAIKTAPLEWLVEGYNEASERFGGAASDSDPSGKDKFKSLFEALNWAVSIDDYLKAKKIERPDAFVALRFVRNRVHHHWAAALERRDLPGITQAIHGQSRIVRGSFFDWSWLSISDLPDGENDKGEALYESLLAEKPVRAALDEIKRFLSRFQ